MAFEKEITDQIHRKNPELRKAKRILGGLPGTPTFLCVNPSTSQVLGCSESLCWKLPGISNQAGLTLSTGWYMADASKNVCAE